MIRQLWDSLAPRARVALVGGVVVVVCAFGAAAIWLLRTDYQVLFADLKPQDAAAMAAELDRMKIPYKIAGDGNTLLVDGALVHATRLKVMGKELPLHGTAGFEIFNNADFGMTEFAQKINYQRALQGELARTILSLSEVRDVRVHLALPEEGLFKKATSKAKAGITLTMKDGQTLRPEQVAGIQRLVSSAVPGIVRQDVTIVDTHGVALTRPAAADGEHDAGTARLDLKRDTERLLARKATEVLERALGEGQALASVDVTLNMDQVRVTTEDVLGAPVNLGQAATGVIVRERESERDAGPPLGARDSTARGANSQREVEYQVGRRVEQVATQPGAVRRLQVVAVVRQALDDKQLEQLRIMVAAAVGAAHDRGDTVVIQSLTAFRTGETRLPLPAGAADDEAGPAVPARAVADSPALVNPLSAMAIAVLAVALGAAWWFRQRSTSALSADQRQALLAQMRQWLDGAEGAAASATAAKPLSRP